MVAEDGDKIENEENIAPVEEKVVKAPVIITLEILKIIKDAQQQHGLRHGDYQRYRMYCSRRVRRLRKVMHNPQGDRRHYKRRDITEAALVDHRALLIPLMLSERAWGFAMQLRQEANTEPRKKFHLISRMRKASAHALALEALCQSPKCDARTRLEAQAYVAWINGSLHFELQLWKSAMEHLKKAQVVYEKLAEALLDNEATVYRHRVEELNPSIRYCAYNTGEQGDVEDMLALRTHGDFIANFDALLEKKRAVSDVGEVKWRGHSIPLRVERVRLFFMADQQLDGALSHASTLADRLQLLEDNLMDCKDAIASLRDEINNDPSSKAPRAPGAALTPLQLLMSYLTYTRLSRTNERNLLMAEQLRSAEGKKPRPQDLARIYEMILHNLTELQTLPGLENDEEHRKDVEGKTALYKSYRCFYIAEYLTSLQRWKEAAALYERATQHKPSSSGKLLAEWKTLQQQVESARLAAHAHSVLEGGEKEDESAATKQFRSRKPLSERLDEYREEPALLTKTPGVAKLPPEMRPIPCKPLFFDLALNLAEFPNLDHKMDASGKRQNPSGITGFVKGFLGWGGSK